MLGPTVENGGISEMIPCELRGQKLCELPKTAKRHSASSAVCCRSGRMTGKLMGRAAEITRTRGERV